MFIGVLLVYAARTAMPISAVAMASDLGGNKQISGMVLSAFFCGYVITNIAGGYMADKHGGDKIIFYSSFVWASLSAVIPYFACSNNSYYSGVTAVIACHFLIGIFQGVFFPSITSIFSKHVHVSERSLLYAFAQSGSHLGTIFTGLLGSIIIELCGWPQIFILSGMFSIMWAFWLQYLRKTSYSNETLLAEGTYKSVKKAMPWIKLIKNLQLWGLFTGYCCYNFVFFSFLYWTPVYFQDTFPQSKGWVFSVIPSLCSFVITIASGYIANVMAANGLSVSLIRKLCIDYVFWYWYFIYHVKFCKNI